MNFNHILGWYYINGNRKSPSWTGVNFLYKFLINNKILGPFATQVNIDKIEPGDIVQLNFGDDIYFGHTLVITKIYEPRVFSNIYVSSHTINRLSQPLSSIYFNNARFLHIEGCYK